MPVRRPSGYSLVEIIIMIVVAGLVLPPLLGAFATVAWKSARPDLETVAMNLAREKMEILAADRYTSSRSYTYLIAANYPAENPVSGFSFNRSVTFTDVASSDLSTTQSGSGYRKAVVTVTWQNGGEQLTLSDVFTQH